MYFAMNSTTTVRFIMRFLSISVGVWSDVTVEIWWWLLKLFWNFLRERCATSLRYSYCSELGIFLFYRSTEKVCTNISLSFNDSSLYQLQLEKWSHWTWFWRQLFTDAVLDITNFMNVFCFIQCVQDGEVCYGDLQNKRRYESGWIRENLHKFVFDNRPWSKHKISEYFRRYSNLTQICRFRFYSFCLYLTRCDEMNFILIDTSLTL